ncbi:MAG: protein ImuB [Verrucomicrobiota bacterium]
MMRPAKPRAAIERDTAIARVLEILHHWGIHTLGQFAALEKQAVGARLGPIGLELWERASGKTTRLLKLVSAPDSFEEAFEFENEIETVEPLLFMLRRFLQQIALRLDALYLVASELQLQIRFSDKRSYEHQFNIPEPTNNVEVLFRMLHTHLENFTSDAPIVAIALKAEATKRVFQQFNLFETALRDPIRLSETLARLTGLLGPDRVGSPVLEETHRPDAFRMERFAWQLHKPAEEAAPLPACALRRFRSPASAAMLLKKNKPAHLRSVKIQGEVKARKGPYHASGNWWGENAWDRAEWDVELEDGALCQCHASGGKWELDGIYD